MELFDGFAMLEVVGLARDHADPLRPGNWSTRGSIISNLVSPGHREAATTSLDRDSSAEEAIVQKPFGGMRAVSSRSA